MFGKTLESYGHYGNYKDLCVPTGLVLNNERDFLLEQPYQEWTAHITVIPEERFEPMIESVLVAPRKKKETRKTRKKK